MGRSLSGTAGASGSGNGAVVALNTVLTTGEAVVQGQLLTLASDNLAYYAADPNTVGAAWRPLQQPATAFGVAQGAAPLSLGGGVTLTGGFNVQTRTAAQLSNGNIAMVWASASAPYNVNFAIYSSAGAIVVPPTIIEASSNTAGTIAIGSLTGGGFGVVYTNAAGNLVGRAFSAAGVSLGSYIGAVTSISANGLVLAGLSNGSFVVSYIDSTGKIWAMIFSANGGLVAGPIAVTAANSNTAVPAVAALSGGGFVVYFGVGTGTAALTPTAFIIYSNVGAVVKAQTNSIPSYVAQYPNTVALTGGGFAVAVNGTVSSTTGASVAVYDANGSLQGAVVALDATASNGSLPLTASATSGSVYVMWNGTGGVRVAKFGPNAVQIGSTLTLAAGAGAGGTSTPWALAASPDDGVLATLSAAATVVCVVVSGTVQQTYAAFVLQLPNTVLFMVPFVFPGGPTASPYVSLAVTYNQGVFFNAFAYRVQKAVVVGVAAASAAANAAVPVQYTGNATLATGWVQPYTFDANSLSPPGQRFSVLGNSILMAGLQPPAARRQIS